MGEESPERRARESAHKHMHKCTKQRHCTGDVFRRTLFTWENSFSGLDVRLRADKSSVFCTSVEFTSEAKTIIKENHNFL